MRVFGALLIKFVMVTVILFIVSGFYGVWPLSALFITGCLVTVISFILGDLYILPATGQWVAVLSDFVTAWLFVGLIGYFLMPYQAMPFLGLPLVSAIFIAIGEYFFHMYMHRVVLEKGRALRLG